VSLLKPKGVVPTAKKIVDEYPKRMFLGLQKCSEMIKRDTIRQLQRLKSRQSRKYNVRMTRVLCLFMMTSFLLFCLWCEVSYGDRSVLMERELLIDKYHKIEKELKNGSSATPFYLESSMTQNASCVDIYGTLKYPFDIVENALQLPANWCDIVLLHTDVRACTYKKVNDRWLLTLYTVKKFQDPLEDAYQMKFEYHVISQQVGLFAVSLSAPEGPFGTKDHRIGFEVLPLDEGRTFVHLRYSLSYSPLGYLLMKTYSSIFGGGRIGFSVIDTDRDGNPVYVGGLRAQSKAMCSAIILPFSPTWIPLRFLLNNDLRNE
jgi:hypothetical protein